MPNLIIDRVDIEPLSDGVSYGVYFIRDGVLDGGITKEVSFTPHKPKIKWRNLTPRIFDKFFEVNGRTIKWRNLK